MGRMKKKVTSRVDPGIALRVFINTSPVGTLTWYPADKHIFEIDATYDWASGHPIMSLSLKGSTGNIDRTPFISKMRLPPFFSNLLPEGHLREYLGAQANINPDREFFLLDALRDDLPGAIILQPANDVQQQHLSLETAGPTKVEHKEDILRFSLAGVQLKFSAVLESSGGLTIPAHGVGGAYVVKLPSTRFKNVPQNEYSMMVLAKKLGMDIADVELVPTSSIRGLPPNLPENFGDSLAVKRFDRDGDHRIHMEDFAQVFNIYPHHKYSKVSYGGIAKVIWLEIGNEGLMEFIRRVTFSLLIGNADMHLKNWSLIYTDPQQPSLSPGYDFVSTITYLPDPNLALSIAREKDMYKIEESHFRQMAMKSKLPEELVVRVMRETVDSFRSIWPQADSELPMDKSLIQTIDSHLSKLRI